VFSDGKEAKLEIKSYAIEGSSELNE